MREQNWSRFAWTLKSPTLPCNIGWLCRDLHYMPHSKKEQVVRTVTRICNTCIVPIASTPAYKPIHNIRRLGCSKDRAILLPSYLQRKLQKSGSNHVCTLWSMWDPAGVLQVNFKPLWSSSTAYSCLGGGESLPRGLFWQAGRWECWSANREQLTV